jgi:hypothetical protein
MSILPGQPIPINGELAPVFLCPVDEPLQHLNDAVNRFVAAQLLVAVTPELEFPDLGL